VQGQCSLSAVPARARARHLVRVEMHAVREPDLVEQPPAGLQIIEWAATVRSSQKRFSFPRLGEIRVQMNAGPCRELRALTHSRDVVTLNGEHGAKRHLRPSASGEG